MKRTSWLSLWIGMLAVLLSAAGAFAQTTPMQPATLAAPSLTLSANMVEATVDSTSITLNGSGFSGKLIPIAVHNSANSGFSTLAGATNGSISIGLTIPIKQTPDVWTITAGPDAAGIATIQFYAFSWSVSPSIGSPGSTVQITGNHFPPFATLPFGFIASNAASTSLGNFTTSKTGFFSTAVTVPANATVGNSNFYITYDRILLRPVNTFEAFKVPTDLSISHLEFTQAIQRWDNSVPLVLGKPLVIRVYVQANGPPGPLAGGQLTVDWPLMDVYHGTTFLGTIGPVKRPIQIAPTIIDPKTLRGKTEATFNFLLPSSWTFADGINFHLTLNTEASTPDSNPANDSASANLFFVRTYPLQVVGLMYADPLYPYPAVPYSDYNAHIDFLKRTWPVPTVNLWQVANPALTYSAINGTDANNPYFPGGGTVAQDADKRRQQASAPYNTFNWYALQPWDTCGCGLALFEPGKGATGQDNRSANYVGAVMAQEIGHNFGQLHTGHVGPNNWPDPNCCPDGGISQNPADPAFGFDTTNMQVIDPGSLSGAHTHDFMSYGGAPIWVSDYTYQRLMQKLLIPRPPGAQLQVRASATVTNQTYLFVSGTISESVGTLDPAYVLERPVITDTQPVTGAYAIELRDQTDQVLVTRFFDLDESHHPEGGATGFSQIIPYDTRTHSLVLRQGTEILATRTASAHAPTVTITKPQAGVHWNGARQVAWSASDADGDKLFFAVHYSSDNGQTWLPLAVDVISNTLNIDAGLLTGSRNCLVRVIATDGINTTIAQSGVFGVDPHQPTVTITTSPVVNDNGQVTLNGSGFDADDGPLADEKLIWRLDGNTTLGNGQTLVTTPLSGGFHTITLTGIDADGNQAAATVQVQIGHPVYLPLVAR